jgi:hypothetical protein
MAKRIKETFESIVLKSTTGIFELRKEWVKA